MVEENAPRPLGMEGNPFNLIWTMRIQAAVKYSNGIQDECKPPSGVSYKEYSPPAETAQRRRFQSDRKFHFCPISVSGHLWLQGNLSNVDEAASLSTGGTWQYLHRSLRVAEESLMLEKRRFRVM
jgi:hypothetical protein